MNSKETLNKVKTLLGLEIKLEERKLENGTRFESEVFEKGREVFIVTDEDERIPVPAGDYILDDGMMLVVKEDGIMEIRIKNLEDAIADLKSRDGEKEDFDTDEGTLKTRTVTEKFSETSEVINHNPENKSKTEMHTYAQNRPMSTQDRVFAKLFNNN